MSDDDHDLGDDALDALLDREWLDWISLAYGESGLGVSGFAVFVLVMGAVGLFNWSESFRVPAVWLVLMTPMVALTLPVPVRLRLAGLVTTAVAMFFVALWIYWNRT